VAKPAEPLQIVLSEANFACIDTATAKGSPVREAIDRANHDAAGHTVVIRCSLAQAEELFRLAQVSCRAAMDAIKTALVDAHKAKG